MAKDPISSGPPPLPHEHASAQDVAKISNQSIAVPVKEGAKRSHKATYARDKLKGGYLVRVEGPHANMFSGKIVPVVKRDDTESREALDAIVWFGKDEETGKPVALYTFTQKPREDNNVEF